MRVIPSNPFPSVAEFERQITRLSPYFNQFQIDIVDSEFATPATIQIEDIASALAMNPGLSTMNLVFDFHLMVNDYETDVKKLEEISKYVRVDMVFVHYSVKPDIERLKNTYPYAFGIALNPDDAVEAFVQQYDTKNLPAVQIMSVIPGAQGRPFMPEVLTKIEQLRTAHYRNSVYLDGGINEESLPVILSQKHVPDVLCPGSFFSKADDVQKQLDTLNRLLKTISSTGETTQEGRDS